MISRSASRIAFLLIGAFLLPLSILAQPSTSSHIPFSPRQQLSLQQASGEDMQPTRNIDDSLRNRTGQIGIVIELDGAPTAQAFAQAQSSGLAPQATRTAQAQLARVDQAQQRLLAPLASLGATVLYRTQRVYNGIAARVDASKLSAIAKQPGVKAIHPLVKYHPDLKSSVPLIGAPAVWSGSNLTGAGIKIAIIDTGIDYIHSGFGGSGAQAAYDANDTTILGDVPFPTAKVIAGYDFAGDNYNGNNTPQPDPDPLDCDGHGSHVAGIAAGNGVKADGTAYNGPYNSSIYNDPNFFRIGPGVAPQASLVALRVFGCTGGTELASEAIEWAVDPNGDGDFSDRVDVINMSLGSDFGYANDPTSTAADNAVLAGTIVVASAGNDADTYFITGSPATSPRVISVASSVDATDILDGFRENTPTARMLPADFSVAYNWAASQPVTANLVYPPSQRTGCAPFSPQNAALIAGKIVLLDWSDSECGSVTRGANAVAAGAKGMILADNSAQFDLFITGSAVIPAVSAPKSVGDSLKGELAGGAVNATLSNEFVDSVSYTDPNLQDTLSTFSSRGPRRDGSALKPDISAPGQGIFSVGALTGNQGANISGTSQAAPHVAGSMALMRQLHPTWTVEELKSLVMNTAVNNIRAGLPSSAALLPPTRIGAGRIDLPRAAADTVLAYNDDGAGLVSVSFGTVEAIGSTTATRTIRIFNKGASTASYNLAYVPVTTIPGVTYSISAATVTVAAGQAENITITMTVNPANMKHVHDPTISETQAFNGSQLPRPWLSEASGYLALTKPSLATSNFAAWISDDQENPPTGSGVTATGAFTYTASSGNIQYRIEFTQPITLTAAHFHSGLAGANGPALIPVSTGDSTFGPGDPLTGSATLSADNAALLLKGELFVNFRTAANPGGEIRGQVVPALADTALRLPIYGSARPASNMHASVSSIDLRSAPNLEATLVLTGTGVNTGSNYPFDSLSLVSALELQYASPNEASSNQINDKADLAYVGVASDVASTNAFTETFLYFGIATHGDWSTPNEVEFDVYIDTDRDGEDDFVLFNSNTGWMTGQDQNDLMTTFLLDLNTNDLLIEDYLNGVAPDVLDTAVFNNNVLLLPVAASDLGLTSANPAFNYHVVTLSIDAPGHEPGIGGAIAGKIDETPKLSYNAAQPGIDTTGGFAGAPAYEDLPGESVPLKYNPIAFAADRSRGILLFHHHNQAGARVQIVAMPSAMVYLPAMRR